MPVIVAVAFEVEAELEIAFEVALAAELAAAAEAIDLFRLALTIAVRQGNLGYWVDVDISHF